MKKQNNKYDYIRITREELELTVKALNEHCDNIGYDKDTAEYFYLLAKLTSKLNKGINKLKK